VKGRGFGEIKGQSHKGFWNREVVQENQVCLNQGHKLVDMEQRELRKHKTKKPMQEENKEEIEVTDDGREKVVATPEVERDQGSKHNVWRAVTKEDKARLRNRGRNKKERQNKNRVSENRRDLPEDTQGDFLQPELEERLEEDQIFFKEQLEYMDRVLKRSTPQTKLSIGSQDSLPAMARGSPSFPPVQEPTSLPIFTPDVISKTRIAAASQDPQQDTSSLVDPDHASS